MAKLRVYRLEVKNSEYLWDKAVAVAVIAESEEDARKQAAEYEDYYLDENETTCEVVPFQRGVILIEWLDG